MNLGESIYRHRTKNNLSQGDLADALDVSRQSVSKWENNMAVPELDKLIKMSELFGITLDELVTGEPPVALQANPSILSIILFTAAAACLIVTVLFNGPFGIHTDEGMMLCLLFVLLGVIVRDPGNRKLYARLLTIYTPLLIAVAALTFLPVLPERILGYTAVYGVVLLIWRQYLRQ